MLDWVNIQNILWNSFIWGSLLRVLTIPSGFSGSSPDSSLIDRRINNASGIDTLTKIESVCYD